MQQEEIKPQSKRDLLHALSRQVKPQVTNGTFASINEALVNMYEQQGHRNLKTFKQWLNNGFVVKKGETALLLWATPKKGEKPGQEQENKNFFPIAFMFSESQVQPLETKNHRR